MVGERNVLQHQKLFERSLGIHNNVGRISCSQYVAMFIQLTLYDTILHNQDRDLAFAGFNAQFRLIHHLKVSTFTFFHFAWHVFHVSICIIASILHTNILCLQVNLKFWAYGLFNLQSRMLEQEKLWEQTVNAKWKGEKKKRNKKIFSKCIHVDFFFFCKLEHNTLSGLGNCVAD